MTASPPPKPPRLVGDPVQDVPALGRWLSDYYVATQIERPIATAGGGWLPGVTDGDIIIGSGPDTVSVVAKSALPNRFIKNSGDGNVAAWSALAYGDLPQIGTSTLLGNPSESSDAVPEPISFSAQFVVSGNALVLRPSSVSNAMLASVAAATLKGRATAGPGDIEDLTGTQVTALLDVMDGDSGAGGIKGLVPAPAAGDAAAHKYLDAAGSFSVPGGGTAPGDVVGPASATDNGFARFSGTTGKIIKDSAAVIAMADGGTGATSQSGARSNLGLAIGTDVQAFDGDLAALAAQSGAGIAARTGTDTWSLLSGINAAIYALSNITTAMFAANVVDTDGTLAANSSTRIPSQSAVKTYADQIIAAADAMVFKGVVDCSANPNYPAADRGWTYKVSVAGKIGGVSGPKVEAGDTILCLTDGTASGNHAIVGANWNITQANLDGAVIGPASSTDGNFALYDGTGGKVIKDSGIGVGGLEPHSDILTSITGQGTSEGFLVTYGDGTALVRTITAVLPVIVTDGSGQDGDPEIRLAQGSALSVFGVAGNATADRADIAAATNYQVLRRSGTAVGFGAIALDQAAAVSGLLPVANQALASSGAVTPVWSGGGTPPSLGNGTLTGRVTRIASDQIYATIELTIGSTSTMGTSFWTFTLPAPYNGVATAFGGGNLNMVHGGGNSGGTVRMPTGGAAIYPFSAADALVTATVPFTWVAGDTLEFGIWITGP